MSYVLQFFRTVADLFRSLFSFAASLWGLALAVFAALGRAFYTLWQSSDLWQDNISPMINQASDAITRFSQNINALDSVALFIIRALSLDVLAQTAINVLLLTFGVSFFLTLAIFGLIFSLSVSAAIIKTVRFAIRLSTGGIVRV